MPCPVEEMSGAMVSLTLHELHRCISCHWTWVIEEEKGEGNQEMRHFVFFLCRAAFHSLSFPLLEHIRGAKQHKGNERRGCLPGFPLSRSDGQAKRLHEREVPSEARVR